MAKYDWDKLTLEFIASGLTIEDFAVVKKIPLGTINKAASRYKWVEKRSETGKKVVGKSLEMVSDDRAEQLAQQNQRDLQGVETAYAVIMAKLASNDLKPQDIKALSGSLKDLQAIARLALGANTESTDMNISADFETWINERTANH